MVGRRSERIIVEARRVLVVGFHPAARGQAAGTHLTEVAHALRALGWQVSLLRPRSNETSHPSMLRRVVGWGAVLLRATAALRHPVQVVYVRSHPAGLLLGTLARIRGAVVVQEVNGTHEDYLQAWPALRRAPWLVRRPVERQLRRADAVVAVTDGLAAWVRQTVGREATVVPNGVDADRFRPDLARHAAVAAERYVAFVGALTPWQGLATLLAASDHPDWPQDVALVVAGDGVERPAVVRAAEANPDRVHWLGSIDHTTVPNLLANALACAVTSIDREGTGVSPIKLYEAMAVGVPVIVPDVVGSAATVRAADGGIVVPREDPAALAAAVARLAADPNLVARLGANARAAAVAEHTWARRGADTSAVLVDAVASGARR